jgi:hypothetical protein
MASQQRYGERGEATAQKASCSPLALSIIHLPLIVTYGRVADILRPVLTRWNSLLLSAALEATKSLILNVCPTAPRLSS